MAGELKRLLAPMTPKVFLERYWAREAVHIRGSKDKFKGLFSKAAFWKALKAIDAMGPQDRALIRAHFEDRDRPPEVPSAYLRCDAGRAKWALERGATLCVNVISDGDVKLKAFATAVKQQLGWPGLARFNGYWSPDRRGLAMHFDARIACTLQIAGRKTWWFTRHAVVDWPRANAELLENGVTDYIEPWAGHEAWERPRPTGPSDFEQVTLEPGDVLVVPAGAWHAAAADGESLALNLAMDAVSPLTMLYDALDAELRSDVSWRVAPPAPDGSGPKFLRERSQALRKALEKLEADEKRLARAWKTRVQEPT
jgi:ribosomal protein L16 Arg81 hydroxylase